MAHRAEFNPVYAAEQKFGPDDERDETPLQTIEAEMKNLRRLERAVDNVMETTVSRAKEKWGNIPIMGDGRIDFTDVFFMPEEESRRDAWERDKMRAVSWKSEWDKKDDALALLLNNEIEQKAYDASGNPAPDARYSSKAARAWRRYESLRMADAFEKYKTHILGKFLGGDFLVMRASIHDDIVNGIDNVLVRASSGDVVCAFDEVVSERDEAIAMKRDKVEKINIDSARALSGGRVEYAMTLKNGKAEKISAPHVPIFYLYTSKDKLKERLRELGNTRAEEGAFIELSEEISEQAARFKAFPRKTEGFEEKVDQFLDSFARARQKP